MVLSPWKFVLFLVVKTLGTSWLLVPMTLLLRLMNCPFSCLVRVWFRADPFEEGTLTRVTPSRLCCSLSAIWVTLVFVLLNPWLRKNLVVHIVRVISTLRLLMVMGIFSLLVWRTSLAPLGPQTILTMVLSLGTEATLRVSMFIPGHTFIGAAPTTTRVLAARVRVQASLFPLGLGRWSMAQTRPVFWLRVMV